MKAAIIAGCVLLLVPITVPGAHAKWKPKPLSTYLPGEMQGSWCLDNDKNNWDTLHRNDKCPAKDRWTIVSDGWRKNNKRQDFCAFFEIDKLDRYVYQIGGKCEAKDIATRPYDVPNEGWNAWKPSGRVVYEEVGELHLVDGALVYWYLPDV
jgi:hypothetical protein